MGGRGAMSASGKAGGGSFVPQKSDETTDRLNGKTLLLSANTITIKDENGKTSGMVRDIKRINTGNPRDMWTIHEFNKRSGVDIRNFGMENIYQKDGKLYLLNNTNSDAFKLTLKKTSPSEYNSFIEKKKKLRTLENAGVYIINYKKP